MTIAFKPGFLKRTGVVTGEDASGYQPPDCTPAPSLSCNHEAPVVTVRRLTPVECARLQGFPDSHINVPWRNRPVTPDGPQYKAYGNSMAVPVMRWIGTRIKEQLV